MKNKLLLLLTMVPALSYGQVIRNSYLLDKKFPSEDQCGLKRFTMTYFDNEFVDAFDEPGRARFSMTAAIWETTDPSCVKDYGVVQYIKGCLYSFDKDPETGKIKKYIRHARESRGRFTLFKHPKWEVDSLDMDPLYSSYDREDPTGVLRFDWHKFSKRLLVLKPDQGSLKKDRGVLFHNINYDYVQNDPAQTVKQIYVTDIPTGSRYVPGVELDIRRISISSLEFKTCLYKTSDIPKTGDPTATPIHCYEWSDKMEFDFAQKTYKRADQIDPFCLE